MATNLTTVYLLILGLVAFGSFTISECFDSILWES